MEGNTLTILGGIFKAVGWAFLPLSLLPILYLSFPKIRLLKEACFHITSLLDGFSYHLGEAVKWLLLIMIGAVIFAVIALSIFGISFTKLDEIPIYMHATLIMLGSAATLLAGQHVRVDIFHSNYNPQRRALLDLFGFYAFVMPVCLILLWMSQSFVAQSWLTLEGSGESTGIRGVFLLKTLIPVFALTMLLQGFAISCRAALKAHDATLPARPAFIPPLFEDHYESPGDAQTLYGADGDFHDWTQKESAQKTRQETRNGKQGS